VPDADAEIARSQLLAIVPEGFEEVDCGAELELAAYTDESGEELLRRTFASVEATPVDDGWEDRWRAFHHGLRVGGLWIGPPWEQALAGETAVVIEPGRAFGTGAHPTTRACIELLDGLERGSVLDAGSGSGVIAIAAARLGFRPVFALDVDPVAVDVARENARLNGVEIDVREADVLADELPDTEILVGNITLAALDALLARTAARYAVTSGYLEHEAPSARGWERVARMTLDGWAADLCASVG
jgi:ribosomal protein L11 methyltransferase